MVRGSFRGTFAEVNLTRLKNNYSEIMDRLGKDAYVCPMVKANAYGHGDVEIVKTLIAAGAKRVGVCTVDEAVKLRDHEFTLPILVFDVFDHIGAQAIVEYELNPVISCWEQLEALKGNIRANQVVYIHLKFNTGMNRLGFDVAEAKELCSYLNQEKQFRVQGVCSHLSHGQDAADPKGCTQKQIKIFSELTKIWNSNEVQFHILNSSAIFGSRHKWGARPGLALYGAIPETKSKIKCGLQPIMQIKSRVALVRKIKKGAIVSYSGRWKAKKDSVIGVVPIGYEDGYLRSLTNRSKMLIKGKMVSTIGTICMDYTMVDLSTVAKGDHTKLLGEEVVIMGEQLGDRITPMDLADWADTIPYEIMTSVGNRIRRNYIR